MKHFALAAACTLFFIFLKVEHIVLPRLHLFLLLHFFPWFLFPITSSLTPEDRNILTLSAPVSSVSHSQLEPVVMDEYAINQLLEVVTWSLG